MHIYSRNPSALRLGCLFVPVLLAAALTLLPGCGSDQGSDSTADEPLSDAMVRKLLAPLERPPHPSGPMVTVPRVVGVPQQRAARELDRLGLHISSRFPGTVGNPTLKPTSCYSYAGQGPAPGTRVPRGSTVTVTVVLCSEVNGQANRLSGHS